MLRDYAICQLCDLVEMDMKKETGFVDDTNDLSAVKSLTTKRGTISLYMRFAAMEHSVAGAYLLLWACMMDRRLD